MWEPVLKLWKDFFQMLARDVIRGLESLGQDAAERERLIDEGIADGDRHAVMLQEMLDQAKADWSREWKRAGGVEPGNADDKSGDLG